MIVPGAGGSMKDIEIIVKLHNYYRQQIAMGNVTGQPKASNMKRMVRFIK